MLRHLQHSLSFAEAQRQEQHAILPCLTTPTTAEAKTKVSLCEGRSLKRTGVMREISMRSAL